MSLIETRLHKDFSYTPGGMPHIVIGSTNAYAQTNQYDVTLTVREAPPHVGVTIANTHISVSVTSILELLIPGTKIRVYRISALLDGGMTIEQVLEDFPSLTEDQVLWSRDYARIYPNLGKQYPKQSLKRILRQSGMYELDQELKNM